MELLRKKLKKQLSINQKNKNVLFRNNAFNHIPSDLSIKTSSYATLSNSSRTSNLNSLYKSLTKRDIIDSKKFLIIEPIFTHRNFPSNLENNKQLYKEEIMNTINSDVRFTKPRFKSLKNFTLRKTNSIIKYKGLNFKEKYKIKEIKPSVYYPSLSNIPKDIFIKNSRFDKYYGKNLLFSKLSDLNYRNEITDLGKKFIEYGNILQLKKSFDKNRIQYVEKANTYKILNKVRFHFKSPSEKSKLKYMTDKFNTIYSINKY